MKTVAWVMVTPIGTYYEYVPDGRWMSCTSELAHAEFFKTKRGALDSKKYRAEQGLGEWSVRGDRPMRIVLENRK